MRPLLQISPRLSEISLEDNVPSDANFEPSISLSGDGNRSSDSRPKPFPFLPSFLPSSAHFNVNNNEFGLKLYPDTETCYLSTLTLDLKEGLHRPEVPSFFEDPKIALHKTSPLARITPRRSPSRRSIVEGSVEKPSQEDIER